MRISEYSFNRLVCNNASEKDIAKLLNISIEEATSMIQNDLKGLYEGIDKIYNTSENIDTIIDEYRIIEEINNMENIKMTIKEFQSDNKIQLSSEDFIEALEYCKIRVPKACYIVLNHVSNNNSASLNTRNKKVWATVFNAIDKLRNYNLA